MQALVGAYLWRNSAEVGREKHWLCQSNPPEQPALLLACWVFPESAGVL